MDRLCVLFIVLLVAFVAVFGIGLNGCSEDLAGQAVGKLIESPSEEICYDSDGGIIPDEGGVLLMGNGSLEFIDECVDKNTLKEYHCAKLISNNFKIVDCAEYGLNNFGLEYVCDDNECAISSTESDCTDEVDNDGDGDLDCEDNDCYESVDFCMPDFVISDVSFVSSSSEYNSAAGAYLFTVEYELEYTNTGDGDYSRSVYIDGSSYPQIVPSYDSSIFVDVSVTDVYYDLLSGGSNSGSLELKYYEEDIEGISSTDVLLYIDNNNDVLESDETNNGYNLTYIP